MKNEVFLVLIIIGILLVGCVFQKPTGEAEEEAQGEETPPEETPPEDGEEDPVIEEPIEETQPEDTEDVEEEPEEEILTPTVDMKVNGSDGPITINTYETVILEWTITGDPNWCLASGSWGQMRNVTGGSLEIEQVLGPSTFKYTLTCSNDAGSSSDSVIVHVLGGPELVPGVDLKVNGSDASVTINTGETAVLEWTTWNNPTWCLASDSWEYLRNETGGSWETPSLSGPNTFTYTLTCGSSAGASSNSVIIHVLGELEEEPIEEPTGEQEDEAVICENTGDIEGEFGIHGTKTVILLVDPNICGGIKDSVLQFRDDLISDEYTVIIKLNNYQTPEQIRGFLRDSYYSLDPELRGTILIGNIPYTHQVIDRSRIPGGTTREAISFQFYQDLDGIFEKTNGNFPNAYSTHSGNMDSEIWISVLPYYKTVDETITKINYYFEKNHDYRIGNYENGNGFIDISEHSHATTEEEYNNLLTHNLEGQYSWIVSTEWDEIGIFFDNDVGQPGTSEGYTNLADNKYLILSHATHGTPLAAGTLTKTWLAENRIEQPLAFIGACNSGNLDYHEPPILEEMVYSPNSKILLAQGTTANSGGLGTNENGFYGDNILSSLANGDSIGDAVIAHVNTPLRSPWSESKELHHGIIIMIGDGTLTFPVNPK